MLLLYDLGDDAGADGAAAFADRKAQSLVHRDRRNQFYFRTTDVTGTVHLPEGTEMVMPGDNIMIVVELIAPIAMEQGLRFAIREGGRTVGSGVVSKILK